MKLKDCALNINVVVSAPLLRKSPDKSWLSAYKRIFHLLTEAFKIKKDCGCDISCDTQKRVAKLTNKYKFKHF